MCLLLIVCCWLDMRGEGFIRILICGLCWSTGPYTHHEVVSIRHSDPPPSPSFEVKRCRENMFRGY